MPSAPLELHDAAYGTPSPTASPRRAARGAQESLMAATLPLRDGASPRRGSAGPRAHASAVLTRWEARCRPWLARSASVELYTVLRLALATDLNAAGARSEKRRSLSCALRLLRGLPGAGCNGSGCSRPSACSGFCSRCGRPMRVLRTRWPPARHIVGRSLSPTPSPTACGRSSPAQWRGHDRRGSPSNIPPPYPCWDRWNGSEDHEGSGRPHHRVPPAASGGRGGTLSLECDAAAFRWRTAWTLNGSGQDRHRVAHAERAHLLARLSRPRLHRASAQASAWAWRWSPPRPRW